MTTSPKIELHVHLEGSVRPATLLAVARRNDVPLPAQTVEELSQLYEFRDFAHFIDVWVMTTNCLRGAEDFRQYGKLHAVPTPEQEAQSQRDLAAKPVKIGRPNPQISGGGTVAVKMTPGARSKRKGKK